MFEVLIKRKHAEDRQLFIRTGMICASVINSGFCRPEEPVKVEDFVPDEKKSVDLSKMKPEDAAAYVMSTFAKNRI